jgi:hypothetical protein
MKRLAKNRLADKAVSEKAVSEMPVNPTFLIDSASVQGRGLLARFSRPERQKRVPRDLLSPIVKLEVRRFPSFKS